jgi:hypothetical protein
MRRSWEKHPDESWRAYEAFRDFFRDQPPPVGKAAWGLRDAYGAYLMGVEGRPLGAREKVALWFERAALGKDERTGAEVEGVGTWPERKEAWDADCQRMTLRRIADAQAEAKLLLLDVSSTGLGKVREALDGMTDERLERISLKDAAAATRDLATAVEKTGEPIAQVQVSVEQSFGPDVAGDDAVWGATNALLASVAPGSVRDRDEPGEEESGEHGAPVG